VEIKTNPQSAALRKALSAARRVMIKHGGLFYFSACRSLAIITQVLSP